MRLEQGSGASSARAYAAQEIANTVMSQVFWWMAFGLAITGGIAMFTASSETMLNAIIRSPLFFVLIIGELGLVVALLWALPKLSPAAAQGMFLGYSALNGLTLSVIFITYTSASIATTFFITGGMFGAMAVYGTVTKRDLTSWGSFLFMGLIGMIIAMVVNIFLQSTMLYWLISFAGVLIFTGLTAYDVQKIRGMAVDGTFPQNKLAIYGALRLYLDFINLFLMLLRIFGDRR
jgi:hypothetical protein